MFKPLHNYESSLREKCKEFPKTAVNLIEILLSIDPQKRGTASSALMSEVTSTKSLVCLNFFFKVKLVPILPHFGAWLFLRFPLLHLEFRNCPEFFILSYCGACLLMIKIRTIL